MNVLSEFQKKANRKENRKEKFLKKKKNPEKKFLKKKFAIDLWNACKNFIFSF